MRSVRRSTGRPLPNSSPSQHLLLANIVSHEVGLLVRRQSLLGQADETSSGRVGEAYDGRTAKRGSDTRALPDKRRGLRVAPPRTTRDGAINPTGQINAGQASPPFCAASLPNAGAWFRNKSFCWTKERRARSRKSLTGNLQQLRLYRRVTAKLPVCRDAAREILASGDQYALLEMPSALLSTSSAQCSAKISWSRTGNRPRAPISPQLDRHSRI
jgi:hypothetical protein